ncbi:hypothetical protein AB0L40_19800, partial [Patulibacter sp. NPDC049589]|uniref:hypothetical protein n=1 Tax=Patulibacter sp. NPDC049589 TaxID=3154731 RepID=UPI0034308E45
ARAAREAASRARRSRGRGPSGPSGRRSTGCLPGLIALVVVAAVIAVPVVSLVGTDDESGVRGVLNSLDDLKGAEDAASMLRSEGLRGALARLEREMKPGEKVFSLSIRREYLSGTVATATGAQGRSITIRRGSDVSTGTSGATSGRGVPLEALDRSAPTRLIEAARRGTSGAILTDDSDYVVLDAGREPGDPQSWALYLEGGARWTGDGHGRHVIRSDDGAPAPEPGEPGPARKPTGITGTSMVRSANVRRALQAVEPLVAEKSVVTGIDVRPGSVAVTTRRGYQERRWTVNAAFGVEASAPTETTQLNGIPFSAVNPMGPERALRRIESRAKNRATSRVDYVLLNPRVAAFPGSRTVWGVYLKDGSPVRRYWRATLDGRRVGEPGKPGTP